MIRNIIRKIVRSMGYEIISSQNPFSMAAALKRCADRGLIIQSVIDVGASDGRWSELCMDVFPNADYLLIEAQQCHQSGLECFVNNHPRAEYVLAAAGDRSGTIFFDTSDPFGGSASDEPTGIHTTMVPVTTVDCEVAARGLKPPFLLKLDTHGFEIPILEGSRETIRQSGLIIIETYNYRLKPDSLRYFDMSAYMENVGFSSIEVADFLLRKKDNSFWQMDTFYIPSDSKEFSYSKFE